MNSTSAFDALTLEEQMAIRYHLRSSGWSGDYEARCAEIAQDRTELDHLLVAYRKYSGTGAN